MFLTVLTIAMVPGLIALGFLYRQALRSQLDMSETLRQSQQRVQQVEQELGALCKASLAAGDHVVRLERQVERIMERQNALEMRLSSERPYRHASELVHNGADIEELVDSCGLTRGEAELLVMMQRGAA
jgi:hypothetical protein